MKHDMRMRGVIERRLLVNYRGDPQVAQGLLPAGLRPVLADASAVVGICMLRLGQLRPDGAPASLGRRSENVAHRITVEWDDDGGVVRRGVYIPRRDSASRLNVAAGGRLFPGVHRAARFEVREDARRVEVSAWSPHEAWHVAARVERHGPDSSRLFAGRDAAATFFRDASIGWSPGRRRELEGVEMALESWSLEPVVVRDVRSSFLDDPNVFPPGSLELDGAYLMSDVPVLCRAVDAKPPGRRLASASSATC